MMSYNGGRWRLLSLIVSTIRSFCLRITLFLFGDILTSPEHVLQWTTDTRARPRAAGRQVKQWLFSHITYLPNLIILFWIYTLARGEYGVFDDSVNSCDWASWEKWPAGATPHHLAYVADPQLVDPHTYPGRPWPLSTLTIQQTDLYMRRAYSRIQRELDPSTIFFLGDLFDGGREWSTDTSESPEEQYRKYGSLFWQHELDRFSSIFLREWGREEGAERRIIASLPGNHDLGFGKGIQKAVRDRFQAFFGDGNRIDVIGNHTFVSLDSVSFSAKEDAESTLLKDIWQPADTFLENVKINRAELVKATLGGRQDPLKQSQQRHAIEDIIYPEIENTDGPDQPGPEKNRIQEALQLVKRDLVPYNAQNREETVRRALKIPPPDFPTVLLTHVPLFRAPGTPCGPLRERHPPSLPPPGQTELVNPDFPNSIDAPGHGYQYQNVMSETLSKEILNHVMSGGSSDLKYVFSGDDHDYCELVHHVPFSAGVKEITVKSISFAMGVRRPGFVLASLWNPVDENGQRLAGADEQTMQTHLCLLPDQLGTFIHYGLLIGVSVAVLTLRAIAAAWLATRKKSAQDTQSDTNLLIPTLHTFSTPSWLASRTNSTLPTTGRLRSYSSAEREKRAFLDNSTYPDSINRGRLTSSSSSSKSHASPARSRNGGMAPIPLVLPSYVYSAGDAEAGMQDFGDQCKSAGGGHGTLWTLLVEWTWSLWYVARVAGVWYAWLLGS